MTVNVYTETIHQLAASTAVVQRLIIHSMHSKEFKTSTICLQICRHQKREEYDKNCRLLTKAETMQRTFKSEF